MKRFPVLFAAIVFATPGLAVDSHKLSLIREELALVDSKSAVEKYRIMLVALARKDLIAKAGTKIDEPGMKELMDRALAKFSNYVNESLSWETVEKEYIADYDGAFSEADLEALLAFERSEDGLRIFKAEQEVASKNVRVLTQFTRTASAHLVDFLKESTLELENAAKAQAEKETEELAKRSGQSPDPTPTAALGQHMHPP